MAGQSTDEHQMLMRTQLGKVATEINAMILALAQLDQPSTTPPAPVQRASSLNCGV